MMPARHQGLLRLFIACALPLLALQSAAAADWQLEKVVELSRQHLFKDPRLVIAAIKDRVVFVIGFINEVVGDQL
ncbi:hypothetical protein DD568_29105, partial [Klebsiella pneumoniae]